MVKKLLPKLSMRPWTRGKLPAINRVALVGFLYMLFAVLVSHLFSLPDVLRALLAQPVLIFLPYLVGKPTASLIRKIVSASPSGYLPDFLVGWMSGISLIITAEIVLYTNYSFSILNLAALLIAVGSFSIFIAPKSPITNVSNFQIPSVSKYFCLSMLYGLVFAAILTYFWPYPYANDNDYIRHAYYTVSVLSGRPLLFYAPYLPTMHTVFALGALLTGVSPSNILYVLWSSRFLFYPIYSGGIFLFVNSLTRRTRFSTCVSVAATSLVYSSQNSLTPGQAAPTNITMVLFPLMLWIAVELHDRGGLSHLGNLGLVKVGAVLSPLSAILYLTQATGLVGYDLGLFLLLAYVILIVVSRTITGKDRDLFLSTSLILIALLLIDKAQGLEAAVVVIAFMFLLVIQDRLGITRTRMLALAMMIMTWVVVDSFYFRLVPYPNNPLVQIPGASLGMGGWNDLWSVLNEADAKVLLILFPVGLALAIALEKEKKIISAASLVCLLLLAYFSPISFSYRFLGFANIIIVFFCAYVLVSPLRSSVFNKSFGRKSLALVLSVLALTMLFFPAIANNDCQNLQSPTVITKQERFMVFEVGDYLKRDLPKDALVIGDVEASGWYQGIASFYGQVNSVYLWENNTYREDLVKSIYMARSSREAYDLIMEIAHTPKYVVAFPDYQGDEIKRWYTDPSEVILLYDDYLAKSIGGGQQSVAKFLDPQYFTLLYNTANSFGERFYVFQVNPKPQENSNNLLTNPSFEEGWNYTSGSPLGWTPASGTQTVGSLDNSTRVGGDWSYRVESGSSKAWTYVFSAPVPGKGGEFYLLKADIKTTNANQTQVKFDYFDDQANSWRTMSVLTADQSSSDWVEYNALVEIPTNASEIRVVLAAGPVYNLSNGISVSWFDDLDVFEVSSLDQTRLTTQPMYPILTASQQTILQACRNYSSVTGFALLAGFLYVWTSVYPRRLLTSEKRLQSNHTLGKDCH